MKPVVVNKRTSSDSRLFGAFTVQHDRDRQTVKFRVNYPRLFGLLGIVAILGYGSVVTAGYLWLHHVRKLSRITVWDVALLQTGHVRAKMGRDQFHDANAAWKKGQYQAAYISFTTALRNAPADTKGRLDAADFMLSSGMSTVAINILEDGLQRDPSSDELLMKTMSVLTSSGRDQDALRILRGSLGSNLSGDRAVLIHSYELAAVLNTEGAAAAKRLLDLHPEIATHETSMLTVSKIQWETKQRFEAITTATKYTQMAPSVYGGYAQLVEYQEAAGLMSDAQDTAARACTMIPGKFEPRILKIATFDPVNPAEARRWRTEIDDYIKEFGRNKDAIAFLADVAGRKGWLGLARSLYENGINDGEDGRGLAMYYADALMHSGRQAEAMDALNALDRQIPEGAAIGIALRQRQIVLAAQIGLHEDVRTYARKLANELSRDPERLELARRRFSGMGITEAVAELSSGASKAASGSAKQI